MKIPNYIFNNLRLIENYALEGKTVSQLSNKIIETNKDLNITQEKLEEKIRNFFYKHKIKWKSIKENGLPTYLKLLIENDKGKKKVEIPLNLPSDKSLDYFYNFIKTYLEFPYNYDEIINILQSESDLALRQSKVLFDKGYEEQNITYYNRSKELQLRSDEISTMIRTFLIIFKQNNIERINLKIILNLYQGIELIENL